MTLKKPKVILLDLDDTITLFNGACKPAWTKTCDAFASNHSVSFTGAELYDSIQNVHKWYWADPARHKTGRENIKSARREVVRYALKALDATNEAWAIAIADNYSELHDSMIAPMPGAIEALELLARLNFRLAVVTNGAPAGQRDKLNRFDISRYFEQIFIDAEIGYSKPDKRIFQYALDTLNEKADDVWMAGDNLIWDVFGAQQLGIFSVWNDYNRMGLPDGTDVVPDLIVSSIYEMAKILEKNEN